MNAEFNWWLLTVGVAAGVGLAWLMLSDWGRREEDLELDDRAAEAAWIADVLRERGEAIDPAEAEEILALHRAYLQQTGLLDSADAEPAVGMPLGADEPVWGPDQWAHESWDEELSAGGSARDRQSHDPAAEQPWAPTGPSTSGGPAALTPGTAVASQTRLFDPSPDGGPAHDPAHSSGRPSIRRGGSVAPRAAPDPRQAGSEPPQP